MGSLKDPKTWIPIPNITSKDCSQKICTIYCRQWCKYVILPSPPPPPSKSADPISPVLIVLITLIGIVFLLIGYYCILARCNSSRNNESGSDHIVGFDQEITGGGGDQGTEDGSGHVPWIVVGKGLDEGLIKSITVCKYRKEDGIVGCTDCSVCLGEFEEDESVKVLPKCSHAFHVYCIDTWLRSHLNCPLCRANVCCDAKSA